MNKYNSLIDGLNAKDMSAQRELINLYRSRLFLFFRLRIKGETYYEDLVQEVFVAFFDAVGKNKISEDRFIAPFIFEVAKRVMYNYFYKQKRDRNLQNKSKDQFELSYDFKGEEDLSNEKANQIIQNFIDKNLTDVDRTILKEFYLKENDLEAVAELLGKSRHYVSVRKERALKKIKNEISKRRALYISNEES